jgi:GNAT superfamily N-acetyltransferase
MSDMLAIRALDGEEANAKVEALAELLIACVEAGASVGFMAPLPRDKARAFWQRIADDAARGARTLLIAEDRITGDVIGTVQLILEQPENQPHRGDIAKMLVHPRIRRRGVGALLMRAAEDAARKACKTLLVLDTANDAAERLYQRSGWIKVGVIPGYALMPDGAPCDTTYYYRSLA